MERLTDKDLLIEDYDAEGMYVFDFYEDDEYWYDLWLQSHIEEMLEEDSIHAHCGRKE